MRILLLDIETAPNTVYTWGLFDQDISIDHIIQTSYILCWSAKWLGESKVLFHRTPFATRSSKGMLLEIHSLMAEADTIVTYNGNRFDIPTLNREFLLYKMAPPAPSKLLDIYPIAKRRFRFASHKMDHIAKELGIPQKTPHEGFQMWVKCMKNEPEAWKVMEQYNRNDVVILEGIYNKLLPWLPNIGLATESRDLRCTNCGSTAYWKRGFFYTTRSSYQRYQCSICLHWFRGTASEYPPKAVKVVSL